MKTSLKQEVKKIIKEYEISSLKEVNGWCISKYNVLSEDFIREFKDKLDWFFISKYQVLSEDFIREFKDKVDWFCISKYQVLSEDFIREFKDSKLCWSSTLEFQVLSKSLIKEFKDVIDTKLYNPIHKNKSLAQKRKEAKAYAKKWNLEIDKNYLYAYRNHNKKGCGMIKPTRYQKSIYYRDWHCDMRKNVENSFGFGIWPEGNTKVKVKIEDWGVAVNRNDGKARVWGFEII